MSNSGGTSFTLQAIAPLAYAIRVRGSSWVERQTYLKVSGAETSVSLISQALNRTYFDEMCRGFGRLLRRGSAPVLVVETAVLQYGSCVASEDTVPLVTPYPVDSVAPLLRFSGL